MENGVRKQCNRFFALWRCKIVSEGDRDGQIPSIEIVGWVLNRRFATREPM